MVLGVDLFNKGPFQITERRSLQIFLSPVLVQEFPSIDSQLFL